MHGATRQRCDIEHGHAVQLGSRSLRQRVADGRRQAVRRALAALNLNKALVCFGQSVEERVDRGRASSNTIRCLHDDHRANMVLREGDQVAGVRANHLQVSTDCRIVDQRSDAESGNDVPVSVARAALSTVTNSNDSTSPLQNGRILQGAR